MRFRGILRRLTAAGGDDAPARNGAPVAATTGDGPSEPRQLTAAEQELVDREVEEARHQERLRIAGIRAAMCQLRRFDVDLYIEFIETGASPDEARARLCGRQSLELHEEPEYAAHAGHA